MQTLVVFCFLHLFFQFNNLKYFECSFSALTFCSCGVYARSLALNCLLKSETTTIAIATAATTTNKNNKLANSLPLHATNYHAYAMLYLLLMLFLLLLPRHAYENTPPPHCHLSSFDTLNLHSQTPTHPSQPLPRLRRAPNLFHSFNVVYFCLSFLWSMR